MTGKRLIKDKDKDIKKGLKVVTVPFCYRIFCLPLRLSAAGCSINGQTGQIRNGIGRLIGLSGLF